MIDVTSLSAYELSQKLHSGEISSVDLCTAYLDRVKKFEKDVQAWQFIDKKLLIEKAEEADTYRKSGKPLGPLHGMPVAIKDIIGTYDMPTECGTVFRKKMSNSQDSEIVNLLKNSGAIIMVRLLRVNSRTYILLKQKIPMIIQEHQEGHRVDQQPQLLHIWPLYL